MTDVRKPLLIVEDDPALQKQMQWAFDNYETIVANDRASAIAQVRRFEPAVVTMDLGLPPQPDDPAEGLKLLEELHALVPERQGDRAHRSERPGERTEGDQHGCARLLHEAVRTRAADVDDRSRVPRA